MRIAFDYADPGSYLTHRLLARWLDPKGLDGVEWVPLELRPPGRPPLDPAEPGWAAMTAALRREAAASGIPFEPPEVIPATRKAMELFLHAGESDEEGPGGRRLQEVIHDELFRARFVEGRDLGRVDVLVAIASEAGLDPAECRTVLGVDRFGSAVEGVRERLLGEGIRGVPTLVRGELRLEGFQGADRLEIFLAEIGLKRPDDAT